MNATATATDIRSEIAYTAAQQYKLAGREIGQYDVAGTDAVAAWVISGYTGQGQPRILRVIAYSTTGPVVDHQIDPEVNPYSNLGQLLASTTGGKILR